MITTFIISLLFVLYCIIKTKRKDPNNKFDTVNMSFESCILFTAACIILSLYFIAFWYCLIHNGLIP